MSRPRVTFADRLDEYMESGTPEECASAVRDMVASINVWARVRRLGFKVEISPLRARVREAEAPLLDSQGDRV